MVNRQLQAWCGDRPGSLCTYTHLHRPSRRELEQRRRALGTRRVALFGGGVPGAWREAGTCRIGESISPSALGAREGEGGAAEGGWVDGRRTHCVRAPPMRRPPRPPPQPICWRRANILRHALQTVRVAGKVGRPLGKSSNFPGLHAPGGCEAAKIHSPHIEQGERIVPNHRHEGAIAPSHGMGPR